MEIRKTIKKIVALGIGATMVGATLFGASAATLGDFPAPFITDGKFSGALVIGDSAAAEDVIGVSAIASSLQYAASGGSSSDSATTTVVGEAYTIETGSNVLNFNESLSGMKSRIDADEMPILLVDGTFRNKEGKESDTEQKIVFGEWLNLTHIYDTHYEDKTPTVGIPIAKTHQVLNYTIKFSPDAESDVVASLWEDLEDRKITILGTEYDITKVENITATETDVTLMKGAIKDSLSEGETKTYTINDVDYEVINDVDYEVTVSLITDTGTNKVKFVVNGEPTDALEEDGTYKLDDGSSIGVREILPNEAGDVTQDMVTFYLGATKLFLDDGGEIEMDDEDVDNVRAYIGETQGDPMKLDEIKIAWVADEDLFITEESEITLPGLGSIKLGMADFNMGVEEEIIIAPDGEDSVEITVPIEEGTATFNLFTKVNDMNWTIIGEDDDQLLKICGNALCVLDENTQYALISSAAEEETHLIEITGVDDEDGITVKDYFGNTIVTDFDDKAETFDVGDIVVTLNDFNETASRVNITVAAGQYNIYTKEGMTIELPTTALDAVLNNTINLTFTPEDKDETLAGGARDFELIIDATSGSDKEASVSLDNAATVCVNDIRETGDDTDVYECYINYVVSTKVVEDRTDSDATEVTITYPGEETYGEVYIAAEGTIVTPGTSTTAATVSEKIDVSATKLASEIADVTAQNLLLVGGPCANTAADEVMGNPADCLAGFEAGKGLIELFEDTGAGNVAILVAGMNAEDTRAASMVLAEYDKYAADLEGKTAVEIATATSVVTEVTEPEAEPEAEE